MAPMVTTYYFDEQAALDLDAAGPPPLVLDTMHDADNTLLSAHAPDVITSPAVGPWFPLQGQEIAIIGNEARAVEPSFTRDYVSYLIQVTAQNYRQQMRFRFSAGDTVLQGPGALPGCIGGCNMYGRAMDSGGGDWESNSAYFIADGYNLHFWQLHTGALFGHVHVPFPLADGQIVDLVADWVDQHATCWGNGTLLLDLDMPYPPPGGPYGAGTTLARIPADCSTIGPKAQTHLLYFRCDAL